MYLNLHFVVSDLESLGFKGEPASAPTTARCRYAVVISSVSDAIRDDVFYVVRAENLPEKPHFVSSGSFVCIGKPSDGWIESGALVYTEAPVSESQVANALAELFDKYRTWEENLATAIDQGLPLESLGDYSAEILGNPIIAQSPFYEVFFYGLPSTPPDFEPYKSYYSEVYLRHIEEEGLVVPEQPAAIFNQAPNFSQLEQATEPTVFTTDAWRNASACGLSFQSMLLNCYSEGKVVARLIVDEVVRPFQNKDFALIETIGKHFKRWLFVEGALGSKRKTRFGHICEQLIAGQNVPVKKIDALLEKNGWNRNDRYTCILLREHDLMRNFSIVARVALSLTARNPAMKYHFLEGRCLIVCDLTVSGKSRDEIIAQIADEVSELSAIATFSSSFMDFMLLGHFYHQALVVERVGRERDPGGSLHLFEDNLADYVVAKYLEGSIAGTLIPDCITDLVMSDREKDTKLTLLLKKYLDNNCNIAETSRCLFLHRNTTLYQIEKIRRLIGVDLENEEVRIGLQIALHSMKVSEENPFGTL